jgi:hypothetical protein
MRKLRSNIERALSYLAYNRMRRKLRRVPVTLTFYLRGKDGVKRYCVQQVAFRVRKLLDLLVKHALAVKVVLDKRKGTIYESVGDEDWQVYEQACLRIFEQAGALWKADRKGV